MKLHIQTRPGCKWCLKAKKLLTKLGFEYDETVFTTEEEKEWFKANIANTFPQIWVNEELIGGYSDLEAIVVEALEKGIDLKFKS